MQTRSALALLLGLSSIALAAGAQPPHEPTWAERCAGRLERARAELSARHRWLEGEPVRIEATPPRGWFVAFGFQGGRAAYGTATIGDRAGVSARPWDDMGLGECPDEHARPLRLSRYRFYDGREAQIRLDGMTARVRREIFATLSAALDECGQY